MCWWSVNDDDEMPGHPRRSVTDVRPPATTDNIATATTTTRPSIVPGDCATAPGPDTDADCTQLNHVVRQSDVLKSVFNVFHATQLKFMIAEAGYEMGLRCLGSWVELLAGQISFGSQ